MSTTHEGASKILRRTSGVSGWTLLIIQKCSKTSHSRKIGWHKESATMNAKY